MFYQRPLAVLIVRIYGRRRAPKSDSQTLYNLNPIHQALIGDVRMRTVDLSVEWHPVGTYSRLSFVTGSVRPNWQ